MSRQPILSTDREAEYREHINSASDAEWELAWGLQNIAFSGDARVRTAAHTDNFAPAPLYIRQARAILSGTRNISFFTEILLAAENGNL